ncbi:MAG: DinB family protein [Proteobacteria bacterium]|nr:DinB family protein [Pseudomonadota bacterium]
MLRHLRTMARYNQWANGKIYDAARALPEADCRRDVGAFFGSIHRTLNHILLTDRIWFARLDGNIYPAAGLDTVLFEDMNELQSARAVEDAAIVERMDALDPAGIERIIDYQTTAGTALHTPAREILGTVFNHQTHHRGQVHDMISRLGFKPPPLDLIAYLREAGAA